MYSTSYAPVISPEDLSVLLDHVPDTLLSTNTGPGQLHRYLTYENTLFKNLAQGEQTIKAILNTDDEQSIRLGISPKASEAELSDRFEILFAAYRQLKNYNPILLEPPFSFEHPEHSKAWEPRDTDVTLKGFMELNPALWVVNILCSWVENTRKAGTDGTTEQRAALELMYDDIRGVAGTKGEKTQFQKATKLAQNRSAKRMASVSELVRSYQRNYQHITAIPVVLAYTQRNAYVSPTVALDSLNSHLRSLLALRSKSEHLKNTIGYVWQILYTSPIGVHARLMLLFGSAFDTTQLHDVVDEVDSLWRYVTNEHGQVMQEYLEPEKPGATPSLQAFSTHPLQPESWDAILHRLKYWMLLDHYTHLVPPGNQTFGRSYLSRRPR